MNVTVKRESHLFESSFQNVRRFAEILYKCKLCTSLPSILTSEESFLAHVNNTHLQDSDALKKCRSCILKFRTKEDLWAHKKLVHSDYGSGSDDDSSDENEKFEIAWQITTDHAELNGIGTDLSKHKKGKKEKICRKQKKVKNSEEFEQDPHVVIAHGIECKVPVTQDSANLLQLTNQIASDAKPSESHGNLTPSSTSEFGKYTKLIREGGNIVYFCQVCNWKSQMKVLFTEHCNSSTHLVKVTIAEQNDTVNEQSSNESAIVQKYGKKGHFMSFLDEKINYYINKRLSNESITSEGDLHEKHTELYKEKLEVINDSSANDDNVVFEIKKEPNEKLNSAMDTETEVQVESLPSADQGRANRRKRKVIVSRLKNKEGKNDADWSDDSDVLQQPTVNKVSRQYIELGEHSRKSAITALDSQFKMQASSSQSSPLIHEKDEACSIRCKTDDREESVSQLSSFIFNNLQKLKHDQRENEDKESEKSGSMEDDKESEASVENVKHDDLISKVVESELYRNSVYLYRCSLCPFVCNDITEYRVHFETDHEPEQTDFSTESGYSDCKTEQWKVQRIRELLTEILVAHPRGNVSRDLILQKVSVMVNEPEIASWGPACNKALRELFPDSLAQRKGKFKKTYFFGVALIEQVQQEQEALQASVDGNDVDFSPLRDMTQDMDRILQHLHTIVRWRGDMEAGVSRDDVLHILGRKIEDPEVQHWGVQCNRAIRILFPHVQMKRKGKYKTTVYFGVTFSQSVTKEDFASLTAPKAKTPKPAMKDDGIKPKLTWRDAIRTIGGKAFSSQDKKSTVTRGWGPMLNPGGPSESETKETSPSPVMYMSDLSDPAVVPPNITAVGLRKSESPHLSGDQSSASPQNMSLLRYHLTNDEFNVYYKYGSDLAKTVWQSKEQLLAAKAKSQKRSGDVVDPSLIKREISDNSADEKSNDADDENSQSTNGYERSSPYLTQKSGNPNILETQGSVMYIKQEVESDLED